MVREGWKSLVMNKLMHGAGALTWYEKEYDELNRIHAKVDR